MSVSPAIFREYDVRGIAGKDLTPEVARLIGRAYAAYAADRCRRKPIAVGRDNRPSGAELQAALVSGLTESGLDVVDVGIVPTPLLYWSTHNLDVGGGIQVTGSHNPPEYNGLKLGVGGSSIWGEEIQRLYELATRGEFPSGEGHVREEAIVGRYVDDVVRRIGKISRSLRVVVDAGNGVGAIVAPLLLERLGVCARCIFCESDGRFPNHHPDPTVPENLTDLRAAVHEDGADLGIAFDGDADRIGVIDDTGEIVWGDHLLILYARDVLARTGTGQPIIFDVKCSQALPDAIKRAGGIPLMWKTGHSVIEEKMHETGAPIAGEMSGHMFFGQGYYGFDDALYGAARLLRIVSDSGRSVSELLADVPRFASTPEIRVDCPDDAKFRVVREAVIHFSREHEVISVDGARVSFGDGWGLIRASNTQPVLVLRFEASTESRLAQIRAEMEGWLRARGVRV